MKSNSQKLIIASSRLPVTVSKVDGELVFSPSSGGLATGLASVTNTQEMLWIGWPGISSDELSSDERKAIAEKLAEDNCLPVFLDDEQIEKFYEGYCNSTLWPLLHYFTERITNRKIFWEAYKQVNQKFAEALGAVAEKRDTVWVHDYQLMLLPEMIREQKHEGSIGFFLHTPFPSYEIFRVLPEREELLNGLLGADLIGFHTYDYVRHFLSSCLRRLGLENHEGQITLSDRKRIVTVDAFPIGIDFEKFAEAAKKIKTGSKNPNKPKLMLSVDRADYTKGIPERLDAFDYFLEHNPDYHNKVSLVLLAVPSRETIDDYMKLREIMEQKVSRINGEYSTVDWVPITYLHQSMAFDELVQLYKQADIMLVTPLRDGMNLVAKEYIACRSDHTGVLLLSELAGAASELPEAVQINPSNRAMLARAMRRALEMSLNEQKNRIQKMQRRISSYTVQLWAQDFLDQLELTKQSAIHIKSISDDKNFKAMLESYEISSKRLLLLDYDGTLRSFVSSHDGESARPTKELYEIINRLCADKKNEVIIVSGRPKSMLEIWFNGVGVDIIAEHGGWSRGDGKWKMANRIESTWKPEFIKLLETYRERTPGSVIEQKDFALVWHYRNVQHELAYVRINSLIAELEHLSEGTNLTINRGNKIIEIKPAEINKGNAVSKIIDEHDYDFLLAIGDDYTDEDMFRSLPSGSFTVKVGQEATQAHIRLDSVAEVHQLLKDFLAD
ncbi:bifunctional alpha,alpha-trehalose-phosphate synthase (UDP-forming)/trehalose-phosphatase [Candidatus Saccharibacteria bacterium]|nr:bifunctional alpha,alpha-trehalose-phosphate synthase (UDP-forming)/trehalose-phosphatase [Candidatus Saccharibacteria bacterium]